MKSTITKTTINNGQGMIDKKESCQIYNETDCSIHSPKGDFKTQKFTMINRQQSNDDNEPPKITVTSGINQSNVSNNDISTNDPPPLPPKRKTGFDFFSYPLFEHQKKNCYFCFDFFSSSIYVLI
jgi:hypothetical protein